MEVPDPGFYMVWHDFKHLNTRPNAQPRRAPADAEHTALLVDPQEM